MSAVLALKDLLLRCSDVVQALSHFGYLKARRLRGQQSPLCSFHFSKRLGHGMQNNFGRPQEL